MTYELMLIDGRHVFAEGRDGIEAGSRWLLDHHEDSVVGWRKAPQHPYAWCRILSEVAP